MPEPLQRLAVGVVRVHPALALESGGEEQGLPAGAGAQVEEAQAGPGLDEGADELAPLVLDLEEALLVGAEAEDVRAALEVERVGGVPGGLARHALGPETLGEGVAVEAEPVGPDGDGPGEVAGGGEEGRLGAQGALELGDERVGPGEPGGPVVRRRTGLGKLGAGPVSDGLLRQVREVPEQRCEQRGRGLRAGVMGEAPPPERDPEEGLGGDGAVGCVPAGMRAEQDRELAGGVSPVEDGAERVEKGATDLGKLGPVELGQPVPGGALERRQRGGPGPRGGPGRHGGRMPDRRGKRCT